MHDDSPVRHSGDADPGTGVRPALLIGVGLLGALLLGALLVMSSGPGSVDEALLTTAADPAPPLPATVDDRREPSLVEEFTDPSLPRWTDEHPEHGSGNDERQLYERTNCAVSDGILSIGISKLDAPITSTDGRALTHQSCSLRDTIGIGPGQRVEVRARTTGRVGAHPAIWLRPVEQRYGPWPASGELDLMETIGTQQWVQVAQHQAGADGNRQDIDARIDLDPGEWHVYGIDWTSDSLRWTVDNVILMESRPGDWHSPTDSTPLAPYDRPFSLNLNVAVGGSWPGPPEPGLDEPAALQVDWVRIYGG